MATAVGGVGSLGVGAGPLAPVLAQAAAAAQQATQPAIDALAPVTIAPGISVDIRPAAQALLAAIAAGNANLIDLTLATANASAQCVSGQPRLSGSSQVAGLKVLGQAIPTDQAVTQAVNVLNTQSISLTGIDVSKLPLPPGFTLAGLQAALQPALSALPPIAVPPQLAQVSVTPNEQFNENGQLTQRALHVQVSLLGQSVADAILGEARVSNQSVACQQVAASQLALQCSTRKLVLIDVLERGGRVSLLGAADKSLIGRTVNIFFAVGGRRVATAVVQPDGFFRATAPLPPRSVRFTNRARYQARIGSERSLNLKLHRRMLVTSISSSGGNVTIKGRVVKPLAAPVQPIFVERRVSCTSSVNVKRIMPRSDGTFSVTVAAPPHTQAAVYRAKTQVRKVTTNPKRFPTFTLPRVVEIA
jgi:hypothetical protein